MTTEMPSNTSKAVAFLGMALASVSFAAAITFTTAASIPPRQPEDALHYVHSQCLSKIIIDVDAGVDDATALLLAMAKQRPGYPEVVAITCTHGNTNVSNVVINVLKTLRVLKLKVPVYAGASASLLITPSGDNYFGTDGLGDVPDSNPPSSEEAENEHAAVALARLAREHPGQLGVVALGPLTNLALAQRLDSKFKENVKQIYWMGGSVEGIGNIKPGIEFNAFMDPEANFIIFNATGPPIITLTWETCIYHGTISAQWRREVLGNINSTIIKFLNAIEGISLRKGSTWTACDGKAIAVVLDPTVATKAIHHNVEPIFQGDARGAIMVDYIDKTDHPKNAVIVTETNVEKFQDMCVDILSDDESNKSV